MATQRWPTFGRDMAAANIRILRETGKYGTLRTPDEVLEYINAVKQQRLDAAANGRGTIDESARATKPDDENRSNPTLAAADPNDENHSTAQTPPTTDNRSDTSNRPGSSDPTPAGKSRRARAPAADAKPADPDTAEADRDQEQRPATDTGQTEGKRAGSPAARRNDKAEGRRAPSKG